MRYFANTSWLFAEKVLRMIVGLFVGIWVARYLGPEQFGLFSYAQSFVGLFTAIATLGLDGIVVRELVKDESRRDELIGTAFYLKLIGAIAVLIVLAVAIQFTSNDHDTNVLVFIIASATIFQAFNVVDMYFQAKVLSKYVVYANVISLFVSSIVKIVLILNDAPLLAFAWATLFDSVVLALGFIYYYIKNNSTFNIQHLTFKRETAVSLLKDSWPLIIAGIGYVVYTKIDQIMLFEYLGSESVGYYSIAITFITYFIFFPNIILSTVFPKLVENYKNNLDLFYIRIMNIYRFFFLLSLSFILMMFVAGKDIIILLYGDKYIMSSEIIFLLSFVFLFEALAVINGRWIWIKNLQIISLQRTILGAFINIGLNVVLIPKLGINGAVYSTLMTLFLVNTIFFYTNKNTKEIFLTQIKALLTIYKIGDIKQWVKK
ncbi:MAG: flippase [Arcobacter butzleri]|nr:flippase [Aliarcobacter butzleri]